MKSNDNRDEMAKLISGNDGIDGVDPIDDDGPLPDNLIRDLRSLGSGPAPLPSADLAALLETGMPLWGVAARRRRRIIRAAVVVSATASVVGLTGVAAAADILPGQSQTVVSRVINDYTPFSVDPGRGSSATPTTTPTSSPTTNDVDRDSGAASPPKAAHPTTPPSSHPESSEPNDSTPTPSSSRTRSPGTDDSPSSPPTGSRSPRPTGTGTRSDD